MTKELQIGLVYVKVDQNGVMDYINPIKQQDIMDTKYQLVKQYTQLFRYEKDDPDFINPVFSIIAPQYIHEVMLVYKSLLSLKGFHELGYKVIPPDYFRIMPAILDQKQPDMPSYVHQLEKGPDAPKPWVAPWYRYYLSYQNNEVSLKLVNRNLNRDPYTVNWIPFINHHAKQSHTFVQYGFLSDWYKHVPDIRTQNVNHKPEWNDYYHSILNMTNSVFSKTDVIIPECITAFFLELLRILFSKTYWYYQQLTESPYTYPSHLWTGSGGKNWNRLLRHLVRRNGGSVTGHDHGRYGIGVADYFLDYLVEFESCDQFITVDCGLPPKQLQSELITTKEIPKIEYLSNPDTYPNQAATKNVVTEIKTIMVPSTIYFEESHDGDHFMQGITAVDWHARLFSTLAKWGYTIIHKPHPPEWYCSLPVNYFQNYFDLTIETNRFEDVMDKADAFLFDFSQSSILFPLIYTRKPLIYVDFYNNLRPEFYQLLEKRCRIITGWYDENNKVQIEWKELQNAIPESIDLVNNWNY